MISHAVIPIAARTPAPRPRRSGEANRLTAEDRPVHEWYRFVLSYPPHLVREYLTKFGIEPGARVLDPFCGTGTTVVECKKMGISSEGLEAHPLAHFAGSTKVDWTVSSDELEDAGLLIAGEAQRRLEADGIFDEAQSELVFDPPPLRTLPDELAKLLLANSISPLPLHKALVLLECIDRRASSPVWPHLRLAYARAVVNDISNLHFGPEVGVGPAKVDAPVVSPWLKAVRGMASDLRMVVAQAGVDAKVHHADAREAGRILRPASIDAVITSPPYPNEKDYTRTTRLESVLLGLVTSKAQLQALKRTMVRSNTRGVYKTDEDDHWVKGHPEIQRIAAAIEARRIEMGKTSGFERLYARVTKLYFGGMTRHLSDLRTVLRPGARLAYVVGDQASYLRVMIRTGQLLASLAEPLGYEVESIDLFRTRLATATREQLREEVVVLRWKGMR